ncbi:EpsG family protein [Loigolactobacillus rennini]|nr:EpsG family protein [Loigolactobacillus rennini]SFZ89102.1 capsular polysaccharide biosynthesis protein [Loigolactobacillus rennini]
MIYIVVGLVTSAIALVANQFIGKTVIIDQGDRLVRSYSAKPVQILLFAFISAIYIVLAGIRYQVGTDYTTYLKFQIPKALGLVHRSGYNVEFLYQKLIEIGGYFGSYQLIFLLTHILIIVFCFMYIWTRSTNYALSLYIFMFSTFFNFSLNGMRQAIATTIFLFATQYIVQRAPLKYFFWIFIAILFHKSGVLYLLFYFLRFVRLKYLRFYFLPLLVAAPVVIVNSDWINSILYWLSLKLGFYSRFFGSTYDGNNLFNSFNLIWIMVNLFLLFLIIFFNQRSYWTHTPNGDNFDNSFNLDINIQVIATLFSLLSFAIPGSFRVIYLFIPIQMTLVPNLVTKIREREMRLVVTCGILFMYALLFFIIIIVWHYNVTLPYQTIFSH